MSENKFKVLESVAQIGDRRDRSRPGGWLNSGTRRALNARERLGYSQAAQTSSLYTSPSSHYSFYRGYRQLFPEQYWSLYKTSPDVRACVDSIVRRIATWDWYVKPTSDPRDAAEYERLTAEAARVADFLRVPDEANIATWQELMTKMATDLLVYDAGVIELVENEAGDLTELASYLGSEWFPVIDEHGRLLHYDQDPENSSAPSISVAKEKIAYFRLFANNRATIGLSLLESCLTECITTLLSSEHAMLALDADEIPPGLLVLGGVAGQAAERARSDLQAMRGKDHRVRVVTSPEPQGIEAKWVELRRTPKDLEMISVIDEMRRAIWRVFGVMPVELGDMAGVPRAAAEVQMDVSSSHLISPILEMIQSKVNAQIIPRLLEERDIGKIVFSFERGQQLNSQQQLEVAQRSEILLRRGVLTVNEVRKELGLMPIEGGDVATVETSLGPVPLTAMASGLSPAMTLPGTQWGDVDDQYPNEYKTRAKCHHSGIDIRGAFARFRTMSHTARMYQIERAAARTDMPSEWQSPSKFKGYRTIDLLDLADAVAGYTRQAAQLYIEAANACVAIIASGFGSDNVMSVQEANSVQRRVDDELDTLAARWREGSLPFYNEAASIGRNSAEQISLAAPNANTEQSGVNYADRAMAYLTDAEGLVGTLRHQLREVIQNATLQRRSKGIDAKIAEISPDDYPEDIMLTSQAVFEVNAHRVTNWTGKLVGLANEVLVESLESVIAYETDQEGADRPIVWYYEWVAAGGRECPICADEATQGFRPLTEILRYPGEDTYCGSNCRCVLVMWTEDEVNRGSAVSLSTPADEISSNPTETNYLPPTAREIDDDDQSVS